MLKRRIFLIYPSASALDRCDSRQKPINNLIFPVMQLPPSDLMYMAAVAEKCGFEAKIHDYSPGGNFIDDLREFSPDYLVANIATPTFKSDMEILAEAKNLMPSLKIIVKGAPFLTYNTNVIYENPFIDYVIIGEPELTLKEILEGVADEDILGICYSKNFQGVKNDLRQFNENPDNLPFPARHLVDNSVYKNPYNKKVQAVINVSRGCPYHCFFCLATAVSGPKVRARSAENIIAEIKECIEKYNITNFFFQSDIFNFDNEWVRNLCQKIIDSGIKIVWSAEIIPKSLDNETAALMYKSGCRFADIGVESGSQKILDNIGKRTLLKDIRSTVNILKKNKIKCCGSFVIGLPWETEKTLEETIKFANEINNDYAHFYCAVPLPGTKYFAYSMTNNLVEGYLNFENAYGVPVVRSNELSKERILDLYMLGLKKFYLRFKFIVKNPFLFFYYLKLLIKKRGD